MSARHSETVHHTHRHTSTDCRRRWLRLCPVDWDQLPDVTAGSLRLACFHKPEYPTVADLAAAALLRSFRRDIRPVLHRLHVHRPQRHPRTGQRNPASPAQCNATARQDPASLRPSDHGRIIRLEKFARASRLERRHSRSSRHQASSERQFFRRGSRRAQSHPAYELPVDMARLESRPTPSTKDRGDLCESSASLRQFPEHCRWHA